MASSISVVFASIVLVLAVNANACSCFPSSFPTQYYSAQKAGTPLSEAKVLFTYLSPVEPGPNPDLPLQLRKRWFFLQVNKVYAGCPPKTPFYVVAESASNGALCGINLTEGSTYILPLKPCGESSLSLCGVAIETIHLSKENKDFLDRRHLCCKGTCRCANPLTPMASCLAQPCAVTRPLCPVDKCVNNYCGGCTAEFFDKKGLPACQPDPFKQFQ